VYYSPLALVLLFSLVLSARNELAVKRETVAAILFFILGGYGINSVLNLHAQTNDRYRSFKSDFERLSEGPYIAWGGLFPYELIYAPLDRSAHARNVDLFLLGSSTLAPTARIY